MTDQAPSTLTEAAAELQRWATVGRSTNNDGKESAWWHHHALNKRIPHDVDRVEVIRGVGDWLATLVPTGTTAGDDRLAAVTRLLLSEVRAQSGHFGGALEKLLGERVHDQRLRGECMTCQLIAIAEVALAGSEEDQ